MRAILNTVREALGDPTNKCYHAAEAFYHLAGGKNAGLKPVVGRLGDLTHWWVQDEDGFVYDPTATQFAYRFPYEVGRGCGFLTKHPSKKASAIIALCEATD